MPDPTDPVDAPARPPSGSPEGTPPPAAPQGTPPTALHGDSAPADAPQNSSQSARGGAESAAGTAAPSTASSEAQSADLRALVARARADYDNLQKRVARDAALERERAKARVLDGLIPVYELALMAAHQAQAHPGPMSEGIALLAREFGRILEREGLVPVSEVGVPFDRMVHEAVAEEASDGVPPGHVSRIVQAGYRLGDKVLRYAKVAVQPAAAAPADAAGDAAAQGA